MTMRRRAIQTLTAVEGFLGRNISGPLMRFHTRRLKSGLPSIRWILLYDFPRRMVVKLRAPLTRAEFRSRVVAMRQAKAA